jgi:glycine cleavage system aminomethyltransferase T
VAATDTLAAEHATLVEGCGLVDRSERGKLALTGAGAGEFLEGQVTNAVAALAPGPGAYAAFLTHKGKMLGDLRILRHRATSSCSTPSAWRSRRSST